jgi:hypothetical protein
MKKTRTLVVVVVVVFVVFVALFWHCCYWEREGVRECGRAAPHSGVSANRIKYKLGNQDSLFFVVVLSEKTQRTARHNVRGESALLRVSLLLSVVCPLCGIRILRRLTEHRLSPSVPMPPV